MRDEQLILIAGGLLAAGIGAALLAGRLRVPGLILFLVLGMAIGAEGTGWIEFEDYELARTIGVIALVVILFEGGLTAGWPEIRPVLKPAALLAVVGTLITAIVTGLAATVVFGLSTLEGLLLGSIVASTDVAAIFALLRGSTLRRKLARTLEGEAGSNDPVAVLLVVGFIAWIGSPDYGLADMLWLFVRQLAIGLAAGALVGALSVWAFRRMRLETAGPAARGRARERRQAARGELPGPRPDPLGPVGQDSTSAQLETSAAQPLVVLPERAELAPRSGHYELPVTRRAAWAGGRGGAYLRVG